MIRYPSPSNAIEREFRMLRASYTRAIVAMRTFLHELIKPKQGFALPSRLGGRKCGDKPQGCGCVERFGRPVSHGGSGKDGGFARNYAQPSARNCSSA